MKLSSFLLLACLLGANALRLSSVHGPLSREISKRIRYLKLSDKTEATVDTASAALSAVLSPVVLPETSSAELQEASYILCAACKTAYVIKNDMTIRGCKVKCCVCEKEWFQSAERILKTDSYNRLVDMSEKKIAEVKKIISENNWPRNPRVDKVDVFVGNLPYTYEEKELIDLFGEYGLTGISLIRDTEQKSKGFAFLELSSMEDAEIMIKEMNSFHADEQRRLSVRLSANQSSNRAPGGGGGGGGGTYTPRGLGGPPAAGGGGNYQSRGPVGGTTGGGGASWTPSNRGGGGGAGGGGGGSSWTPSRKPDGAKSGTGSWSPRR